MLDFYNDLGMIVKHHNTLVYLFFQTRHLSHDSTWSCTVMSSHLLGTLSNDDDGGSENVGKKMNLRSFKFHRVYLDPRNMSNAGDFSWS